MEISLAGIRAASVSLEEEQKNRTMVLNNITGGSYESITEFKKLTAPAPARARPSLLPPPKTAKQAKAFKAIDEMSSNFVKGTEGHTKWILNSAGDAFLTFGTILSRAWALTGEGAYGCLKFWSYVIIILALVGLSGLKILEMILKFFG